MEKTEIDLKQYVGKFIADKVVTGVELIDEVTYLGSSKVKVTYIKGEEVLPFIVFKDLVSDKSYDLSELREKRINPVLEKVIAIICEYEISKEDIEYAMLTKLPNLLQKNLEEAIEKKFGKKIYQITLKDLDDILTK